MSDERTILLLGLGNVLMRDDGIGVHALQALDPWPQTAPGVLVRTRDGGTLGLSLLPEVEDADSLIVLDATRFGGVPGTVKTFEGAEMDRQLRERNIPCMNWRSPIFLRRRNSWAPSRRGAR